MARQKKALPTSVPVAPLVRGGVYVGIDQSLTGTGVVVFDETFSVLGQELFSTSAGSTPLEEVARFINLFQKVYSYVSDIAKQRQVCALMEDFAFSQAHQMAALGGLGWHFRIMLSRTTWNFGTCPTTIVKKVATGKGNADKTAVTLGIYKRWTVEHSDNNIADAYVLGRIAVISYAKVPPDRTQGVTASDIEASSRITVYR
jgi:crossover junction endodeoxyribonuclease RuvC